MKSLEELAARLRAQRVQAGLTGQQLAAANDWAQSKVSRIERGQQMPSGEDIRRWAATCQASDSGIVELQTLREQARIERGSFKDRMSEGQANVQHDYTELVRESTLVRNVETVWVPGLLQIPDYMRRVFREMITLHGPRDDVEAAIAERVKRQQYLYDADKRFEFLLVENVLHNPLPGAAVMRAQFDRFQTAMGMGNVRFGIIPQSIPLEITPQNKIEVYVTDEGPQVVCELARGEHWYEEPEDAVFYERWIDLLWEEALEGEQARELISKAARDLGE